MPCVRVNSGLNRLTRPSPTLPNHQQYVADNNSVTARYGLWKIEYLGTVSFTSNYIDWAAAQPPGSTAYARVQAVRACVVLGLAGLAFQLLASLRLWCTKDVRVRRRFMVACCCAAALDFAFTIVALLLWKASVPRWLGFGCSLFACHRACWSHGQNTSLCTTHD